MTLPRSLKAALDWLWTLFQNPYFWSGLGGLLVLCATMYFLFDAVIMPSYTRHGVSVRVPDVENRSFEEAKRLVQNRNLKAKRQVGHYNPNIERETVLDQNPPPNSAVKPGRRVYLTVNAGGVSMVNVPDLNGLSIREAKNRVVSFGLNVGSIKRDSTPSPYPNTVTGQRPEPGDSLKRGGTVNLWYSTGLGTDSVEVPNVVGQTAKQAQSFLLRRKLRSVIVDPRTSESIPETPQSRDTSATPQFVRRQGRSPNTKVRTGTEIRLFTTDDSTQVPDPDTSLEDTSTVVY